MISFDFDKDCCGCHACMNACPVNAIKMEANKYWNGNGEAHGLYKEMMDNHFKFSKTAPNF